MAVFEYKGIEVASGKGVKGYRDADSPKALRGILRREGVLLTLATPENERKAKSKRDIQLLAFLYRPKGCAVCDQKGFTGRLGIYELLMADDAVGDAVMGSADSQSIRRVAHARGMDSLRDDGARKALLGVTTVEEVVAATQDDMFDE